MRDSGVLVLAFVSLAGLAAGETRFGRPVAKLSNPKDFEFINMEDNRFPVLRKNAASVACIAYRESQRYYIEVAVTNQSDQPIEFKKDFVQFKSGSGVVLLDTLVAAAEVQKSASSPAPVQGLSASRASSLSSTGVTANDDRRGSTQSMLEAMNHTAQLQSNQLATRLMTFAHEKQALILEPKGTRFYIFVFEQSDRKKGPFEISVSTETESWSFPYRD
jgi:hypothetical protein